MTDWCSSTWSSTEPSTYRQLSECVAVSTASEIAQPSEPPVPGNSASSLRPVSVVSDGDGMTVAPYVRMTSLRYGFCSLDVLTIYTVRFRP